MDFKEIAKKFIDWTKKKVRYHLEEDNNKYFREKEIWWAALGKNVGFEIDGKNELFLRPVLIIKKYSKDMLFILPLTTKVKNPIPWYQYAVRTEDKDGAVVISQGRTLSSKRLLNKIDTIRTEEYDRIIEMFIEQFGKKIAPRREGEVRSYRTQ